jgi:hypothetical protein
LYAAAPSEELCPAMTAMAEERVAQATTPTSTRPSGGTHESHHCGRSDVAKIAVTPLSQELLRADLVCDSDKITGGGTISGRPKAVNQLREEERR